jgi:hypothetical protein
MNRCSWRFVAQLLLVLAVMGPIVPLARCGNERSEPQGGSLQFVVNSPSHGNVGTGKVVLRSYHGKPMSAIQFTVVGAPGVAIDTVLPGLRVAESREWLFASRVIRDGLHRANVPDTARIVILSRTTDGLDGRSRAELAVVRFSGNGDSSQLLRTGIREVVGALPSGNDARITIDPTMPGHTRN